MNKRAPFRLKLVLCFCLIVFTVVHFPLEARTQITLTVRTQLTPVAWSKDLKLWFAPGICWVDDFDGGVQSGTLDQTATLKIWNALRVVEFGPGFIRFEQTGDVKEGTLADNTFLCVVNTASNSKTSLTFKGQTTVEFGYDGCVMKGTLAQEATLKSWDGSSKTYPPGTLVNFDGAGRITKAVLPPSGPTPLAGQYNGTCTIVGIDTFPFSFQAVNGVFNGSIDKTLYSLQWQGNYDQAGTIQNGMVTGWVDVTAGGQKTRWTVRGPIQGTIAKAASSGTLSITTSDGNRTWTGNWNVAVVPVNGGTERPVLTLDLSPLDNLRTNQTFTLTAIAENIPSSVTKLQFYWYLDQSKCISADPSGQEMFQGYLQYIAPVNGKATCSITVKASDEPKTTNFSFSVQDEPFTKAVYLSAQKDYTIR